MDKYDIALQTLALFLTLFMVASLFYLYVIVGSHWSLVLESLFDEQILGALSISVSSAFLVGLLALAAAVPTAYMLTYKEFRGKQLIETLLIEFPQTFPPATVGLVYLFMFGFGSPINLANTYAAVIVAKFYVSAPFVLSFTCRRFREIRQTGFDTLARTLGAKTKHVLLWILLPLSIRDLLAGFSLTWARAMGEVAATLIFAGAIPWQTEIFPAVVLQFASSKPELALAASVISAALSIVALLSFKWIVRRRT